MKSKKKIKPKKVNFQKSIYRGVLSELAEKRGCSKQNVQILYHRGNPEIVSQVNKIIEKRLKEIEKTYTLGQRYEQMVGVSA